MQAGRETRRGGERAPGAQAGRLGRQRRGGSFDVLPEPDDAGPARERAGARGRGGGGAGPAGAGLERLFELSGGGGGEGNNDGGVSSPPSTSGSGGGLDELDLGYNDIKDDGACALAQALKANPTGAPRSLKVNANYLGRFGQVALTEAMDMVAELGGGRDITITF